MAIKTHNLLFLPIFLSLFFALAYSDESESFYKTISPKSLGLNIKGEKLSHLHFYYHDTVGGPNATAVPVAQPLKSSSKSFFGFVNMMDDSLTTRPEPNSTLVGRAQGFYATASQTEVSLLMVMNFVFTQGVYNGSTLSVLGRNSIYSAMREMPIVGGTGLFRFARGYAQANSYAFNLTSTSSVAVVEYNVYAFH